MTDNNTVIDRKIPIADFDKSVVELLADGYRVHEIAEKKSMNRRTLEAKIERLKVQLGCMNITHLVAFFFRNKLIE